MEVLTALNPSMMSKATFMLAIILALPGMIIIHCSARLADDNTLDETLEAPTGFAAVPGAFLGHLKKLKSRWAHFSGGGDGASFILSQSGMVLHCASQGPTKRKIPTEVGRETTSRGGDRVDYIHGIASGVSSCGGEYCGTHSFDPRRSARFGKLPIRARE